ncbi:hypothetical protein IW261DRAFT_1428228 [Armillaria novae-zelandiae]|uniref:Uncharacterized protein n=1 Tax=Armillaria novae-zelandiae TaxID=153914 RepID=A0AA39NAS8_9AGAR|nr:hypothetical protein IW261DRAFT_1428228 [Armillaria novae-zelandiae]
MPSNPHLKLDTFCFGLMDWVPMGWGETEVCKLSDCLANDPTTLKPLQQGAVLIRWVFNAIWFCDNAHTLCKCSGVLVKWRRARHARLLHKLESVLELEQRPAFAKCAHRSPQVHYTVRRMLRIAYHGLPKLLEANMEYKSEEMAEPAISDVLSNGEWQKGLIQKGLQFTLILRILTSVSVKTGMLVIELRTKCIIGPEASRASPPTGDVSLSDEEGEEGIEWDAQASVAEEELLGEATDAGVEEQSPTPPGLDAGSLGSEMPLAEQKCVAPASPVPPVAMGEDAREPLLKKAKGFTRTGWPLVLNQQLREGRMQPTMRANMEAMQDEGLLLVGGDSTTDFAFGLVERLGLQSHPREATWDRIVATSEQIVARYLALQYELQNYGPFNEADVKRLLTNCFLESALDEGHAGPEH